MSLLTKIDQSRLSVFHVIFLVVKILRHKLCHIIFQAPGTTKWHEIGRTETIWDNLNPDWEKKFQMEYHFEVHQMLRFTIYDIDSESRNLANHDFLGQMTCSLGEIVTNQAGVG